MLTEKYFLPEPPEVQPFHFDNDLKEGNRAHVSCAIKSGDLPMEFTWRKDGRPLPHDSDVQQQNLQFVSNLLFSKLSARHAGFYTCIVSNVVSVANHTAHLRIKGKVDKYATTVFPKLSSALECYYKKIFQFSFSCMDCGTNGHCRTISTTDCAQLPSFWISSTNSDVEKSIRL